VINNAGGEEILPAHGRAPSAWSGRIECLKDVPPFCSLLRLMPGIVKPENARAGLSYHRTVLRGDCILAFRKPSIAGEK